MSGLELTVHGTVGDLPVERWDALAAGSLYSGHGWARYQEQGPSLDTRYVVVSNERSWLAAAGVYIVGAESNPLYRAPGSGTGSSPTVLAGNRRGYANRLLLADDSEQALATLLTGVHDVALALEHDHVWWMFVDTESARKLLSWSPDPVPHLLDADCSIDLPGDAFDDFLASSSAAVRKRIRRDRLLFQRAGYRTAELDLAECWKDVARLVDALAQRHGAAPAVASTEGLLRQQSQSMGSAARVDACFWEDIMVGANLRFDGSTETVSRACGFDYALLRNASEYFELTYYRPIEAAYAAGNQRLGLGIGTYETKIRRGAQADLRWAVRTTTPAQSSSVTPIVDLRRHNRSRLEEMIASGLRREALRQEPPDGWA